MGDPFKIFYNAQANFYQGPSVATMVYGPLVPCFVLAVGSDTPLEKYFLKGKPAQDDNIPTHNLIVRPTFQSQTYRPLVNDRIFVSGTDGGLEDGDFIIVDYSFSRSVGTANSLLRYIHIFVRYLGAKKTGDQPGRPDNSGRIILGNN